MLVIIQITLVLFIFYFIWGGYYGRQKSRSQSEIYKNGYKESLLKLLTERSINKVTVTDICSEANINRNTFYSHYANQFELLSTIENDLYEEIKQLGINSSDVKTPEKLSYELCKYIKANKTICEVLFSEHGDKELLERILYISHDLTIERWKQELKYFDPQLFESWYTFAAHGSIAIIKSG